MFSSKVLFTPSRKTEERHFSVDVVNEIERYPDAADLFLGAGDIPDTINGMRIGIDDKPNSRIGDLGKLIIGQVRFFGADLKICPVIAAALCNFHCIGKTAVIEVGNDIYGIFLYCVNERICRLTDETFRRLDMHLTSCPASETETAVIDPFVIY